MSTHVVGFISDDNPTYQKHLKVLKICREANVSLPIETKNYFGGDWENVEEEKLEQEIPKHEWSNDMSEGFEIIISEIPQGVSKIRFYNSY